MNVTIRRMLAFGGIFLVAELILSQGYELMAGAPMSYPARLGMVVVIAVLISVAFDRWWPRQR